MDNNVFDKTISMWVAVAKNGKIQTFSHQPIRGENSWIGEYYINSIIYKSICDMIKQSTLNWNSEPEYLELSYKKT